MKNYSSKINQTLNEILPPASLSPKKLHRAMRYAVFPGGKRIRPILVCAASSLCGGKIKKALPAAAAIELIHCYSLVHDDLPGMDNDDFRRGRPTVHRKFGEATALLAGCGLLTLAFEILSDYPKIASRVARAIGSRGMIGGQELDLSRDKNLKLTSLKKTGELFRVSLEAGALVAGCPGKKLRYLSRFGIKLGELFQLSDDILDEDGFVKLIGKNKTRARARRVAREAKKELGIFANRSQPLEGIIDRILNRAG